MGHIPTVKDWFDEHVEVIADDEDLAKNVKNVIKNGLSGIINK